MTKVASNTPAVNPAAQNVTKQMSAPKKRSLTDAEKAEASKAFDKYDKNKNGTIDKQELTLLLEEVCAAKKMSKVLFGRLVNMHLNSADKDGTGTVDKEEWYSLYQNIFIDQQLV